MKDAFERYHPLISFIYYGGAIFLLIVMLHPFFLLLALLLILTDNLWRDGGQDFTAGLF